MKIDLLSLFAKISIDSSAFEAGINKAVDATKGLGSAVKGAVSAVTDMSLDFVKSSVEVGKSFDTAMSQVAATSGKTMDELESEVGSVDTSFGHFEGTLRDFAKYMGSNTAFSATEAAEALNYMALAGYDTQTSMSMLPNVLNLAAAGAMELGSASDMVTDVSSALGLTIDETTQLVDKMATAAASSNTSVAALGDALLTVGGTAKNMAGGTTEMATVLGLLADNGVKASEGGTALRNILLNLTPKSEDAAAAMERIGLQAYDAEGRMRPMQDIFLEMNEAMKDMSDLERQNILATIFNKVDLKSVEALLGTSKERWEELTAAIDESGQVGGAAAQMAATQLDNLEGDLTLFGSALEGLQIAINDGVSPALRAFVQFGTDGLSRLTAAIDEGGMLGAVEELGNILAEGLGKFIDNIPNMIDVGVKILLPLGRALVENIPKLIGTARELAEKFLGYVMDAIPEVLEALGIADEVQTFFDKVAGPVQDAIEKIRNSFTDAFNRIKEAISPATDAIGGFISGLDPLQIISDIIIAAVTAIADVFSVVANAIATAIEVARELIDRVAGPVSESFSQLAETLVDAFGRIVAAVSRIIDVFQPAIDKVTEFTDGIDLMDVAANVIITAVDLLTTGIGLLADGIAFAVEKIADFVEWLDSGTLGAETFKALVIGLTAAFAAYMAIVKAAAAAHLVLEAAQNAVAAAQAILNAVMSANPIGILITLLGGLVAAFIYLWNNCEEFRDFWIGVWDNILTAVDNFATWFENLLEVTIPEKLGNLIDFFKSLPEQALKWGQDLIDNFKNGIKEKAGALGGALEFIGQGVVDVLGFSEPKKGPLSNFHTFAPDMIELFAKGVRDNAGMLQDTVTGAFDFESAITAPTMADAESKAETSTNNNLEDIASMLAMYLPKLSEMNMYIDEDTLIGSTVRGYDTSIDRLQVQKGREGFGAVVSS